MTVHNALSCRRQRAAGSCRIQTPIPRFPASNGACHSPVSGIGQMGPCPRWVPTWTRPRLTLFAWPLKNFSKLGDLLQGDPLSPVRTNELPFWSCLTAVTVILAVAFYENYENQPRLILPPNMDPTRAPALGDNIKAHGEAERTPCKPHPSEHPGR